MAEMNYYRSWGRSHPDVQSIVWPVIARLSISAVIFICAVGQPGALPGVDPEFSAELSGDVTIATVRQDSTLMCPAVRDMHRTLSEQPIWEEVHLERSDSVSLATGASSDLFGVPADSLSLIHQELSLTDASIDDDVDYLDTESMSHSAADDSLRTFKHLLRIYCADKNSFSGPVQIEIDPHPELRQSEFHAIGEPLQCLTCESTEPDLIETARFGTGQLGSSNTPASAGIELHEHITAELAREYPFRICSNFESLFGKPENAGAYSAVYVQPVEPGESQPTGFVDRRLVSVVHMEGSEDIPESAEELSAPPEPEPHMGMPVTVDIRPPDGAVPNNRAPNSWEATREFPSDREWGDLFYSWASPGICHRPLYFEEVNLERYGLTRAGRFQPLCSGAHFFGNAMLLPYRVIAEPSCQCTYVLGHHRPGDCVCYQRHWPPLRSTAGLFQAGTVAGLVYLLP